MQVSANPLWPAPPGHSLGGARCEGCVWRFIGGRGRPVPRCRRHQGQRLEPDWPACPAFTPALDCGACGACCREAFHVVELGPRDPFLRTHPGLAERADGRWALPRPGGRCVCLRGAPGAWSCATYADRPRSCADFPIGGESCLEARRRVGLTR